jgi:LacI family transcriptional regulator
MRKPLQIPPELSNFVRDALNRGMTRDDIRGWLDWTPAETEAALAAWAFDKMVRNPGKIGLLVGTHRLRNQELNESGFRSYFREHTSGFTILEPLATYESAAIAREHIETLLAQHPDLCGVFISGGGITGAIAALRDTPKRQDFVAVGYELFEDTRAALIDGTLSMVISHPTLQFAQETIATMLKCHAAGPNAGAHRATIGFDIHISESV